ncbi:MAG: hypothetical protein M3Z85_02270 [Acidobacteriota bacterium]|nr:hypothetical protein [Acidobacteriota bacterium]
MPDTNGHEKSRLDRIEELIERHVTANGVAHDRFDRQYQELLTAQIFTADAMKAMAGAINAMADTINKIELKLLEATEKLDALIKVVDGAIRQNPPSLG